MALGKALDTRNSVAEGQQTQRHGDGGQHVPNGGQISSLASEHVMTQTPGNKTNRSTSMDSDTVLAGHQDNTNMTTTDWEKESDMAFDLKEEIRVAQESWRQGAWRGVHHAEEQCQQS